MAFTGQRYQLALNQTFNGNEDLEAIPAGNFVTGSRNMNTHDNGASKRGGTIHVGGQITASLESLGGGMLIKSDHSRYRYWCGKNGVIYRNGVSVKTGRSTTRYNILTQTPDLMFISNGENVVQVDDGSSIADITTPALDWVGAAQPSGMALHSKEASRRLFAWGVPGKPDVLYYSSLNDFETFDGGTSGTIVIPVGHGSGITNCISKDGSLFIFTQTEIFILDDTSLTIADWGVFKAPISGNGGCVSPRHAIVINDRIYAMTLSGDIYEIRTATELRDYKRASILYPFFLHTYLRKNWNIKQIERFHLAYEPKTEALCVFGVKIGKLHIEECLKFYVNQGKWAPPHDSTDNINDSGLSASASYVAETSLGERRLETQDYNGYTWAVEEENTKSDNGNGYTTSIKVGLLNFDLQDVEKRYISNILHILPYGKYTLNLSTVIDDSVTVTDSVTTTLAGAGLDAFTLDQDILAEITVLGSFILDEDTLQDPATERKESIIGKVGERLSFQLSNAQAGEDFFVSHLIFLFASRGIRRI